jgi:hypothetical protein
MTGHPMPEKEHALFHFPSSFSFYLFSREGLQKSRNEESSMVVVGRWGLNCEVKYKK